MERKVVKAFSQSPTIRTILTEDRPALTAMLRTTLIRAMVISGIRSKDDQDEKHKEKLDAVTEQFLFEYFTKDYANFTLVEIEKAFYLNSIGEWERVQHFGLFDTTFVSKVMEQWIILKSKTRQRMSALLPPKVEQKPPTPEESYNGLVAYVKKHGEFPKFWNYGIVYLYMEELLLIEASLEQKRELYEKELTRLENQLELDILNIRDTQELNRRRESIPEDAKLACRTIMVQRYLKTDE